MMRFAKKIYVSDGLSGREREFKARLKFRKLKKQVYVIYFNRYSDTPEFMNSIFLRQDYYKRHSIYVIGIVENYGQAVEYVADLLKDSFEKNGNFNVKEIVCRC